MTLDPPNPIDRTAVVEMLREAGKTLLPGHLGLELVEITEGGAVMRCVMNQQTVAGYGCIGNMPEGGIGFTTIEAKTNFLSAIREGTIAAEGIMIHSGRTTQVWDVDVSDESSGKTLATFRCTQLILYPCS
jgi:acyl-coenzyme A thioesterase PaaI-like protein